MSEGGDAELFNAPAAQEKSEISDEQMQEEMRRMQQALAQLQREEGQYRAQDQNLAAIIVQFLSQPGNTDLFLLISRAVAQNVPSELILAIIALIDERSTEEVYALLRGRNASDSLVLSVRPSSPTLQSLPAENKQAIETWTKNIHQVALRRPYRVMESVVVSAPEGRVLSPTILQLSAFVLRKYLGLFQIVLEFEALYEFMQAVFVEVVKHVESLLQHQKHLKWGGTR